MAEPFIEYRSGYKYQLATDYEIKTTIKPKKPVDDRFIKMTKDGLLTMIAGYAWDGPSGPVVDRPENMRASLVHDALYQLMRHRRLTAREYKDKADQLFKKLCREDGVPGAVAQAYYLGLQLGGKPNTDPSNKKRILVAPDKSVEPDPFY